MSVLTLSSEAQRSALVRGVENLVDVLEDRLGEAQEGLEEAFRESYDAWTEAHAHVDQAYKRVLFIRAFNEALGSQPVGASVFLEGLETEVVREALESLADVEACFNDGEVDSVFSTENMKAAIVKTSSAWGSVNPAALGDELRSQVRKALDTRTAAEDLLAQLG